MVERFTNQENKSKWPSKLVVGGIIGAVAGGMLGIGVVVELGAAAVVLGTGWTIRENLKK